MTSTSQLEVEDEITYPTFTFCISMDSSFNGGPQAQNWMNSEKYDFSFPITDLGVVYEQAPKKIG